MLRIFGMIWGYIYCFFLKIFYKKFIPTIKSSNNEEYVFKRKNNYLVVVKNGEIGERLYNFFKGNWKTLNSPKQYQISSFKLVDYATYLYGTKKAVKWFKIRLNSQKNWNDLTDYEKLLEIQEYIENMEREGFVLDTTKIDESSFTSFSNFFSLFIKSEDEEKIKKSREVMIKYIHYLLTNGGNLEEFYKSNEIKNVLYDCEVFPYNFQIAKMCYDFYKTGTVPKSIYQILINDENDEFFYFIKHYVPQSYCYILLDGNIKQNIAIISETDQYTVYAGNIKIYKHISSQFEKFLENVALSQDAKFGETLEKVKIIYDYEGRVLGYTIEDKEHLEEFKEIQDLKLQTQKEIFYFVNEITNYFYENNQSFNHCVKQETDLDIEKCLMCKIDYGVGYAFKLKTIDDLFKFCYCKEEAFLEKRTTLFFKLFLNFVEKKYGKLSNKKEFLKKTEIKFLSPILAREFINFALGKQVNYQKANEVLDDWFSEHGKSIVYIDYYFDDRFCLDKTRHQFFFDFEVEEEYKIKKIQQSSTIKLPDGKILVTLKNTQSINIFLSNEINLKKLISEKIGDIEDKRVKFPEISGLVLSTKRLNSKGMYNVAGYILESLNGERLTEERLISFDNKTLLTISAYLFTKFHRYYINFDSIWMTDDFVFYINYMDENFCIKDINDIITNVSDSLFVKKIWNQLIEKGCNPYAFTGINLYYNGDSDKTKKLLLKQVKSFNAYCDKHKIYYYKNPANDNDGQEIENICSCPACREENYIIPIDFEKSSKYRKVYEDETSIHYSIENEGAYLKVYKFVGEKLQKFEENIKQLVKLRVFEKTSLLQQNCFIPYKIAISENNLQFIGYVYKAKVKAFPFEDTGSTSVVELGDKSLNNLARLKCLVRLLTQVKELVNQKIGFIQNPFGQVYLNKGIKKQVQILNIDFLRPSLDDKTLQKTELWTIEYVRKVFKADVLLEQESDCNFVNLEDMLKEFIKLSTEMTEYCPIHKYYYNRKYIFCPKCIPSQKQNQFLEVINQKSFKEKETVDGGEGGESYIYPYGKNSVAKIFKEDVDIRFKRTVLTRILLKKSLLVKINNLKNSKFQFVIPQKVLVDTKSNEIFGYTMYEVQNAYPISVLRDKVEVEKLKLSRKDILEIIITIGEGIETLHKEANIYIGDLNGRNILFEKNKNVYFLDFDGMGIDDIKVEFYTPGYIDPISAKNQNITLKDDWYSYALQAFYYLTYTHPFNGIFYEEKSGKKVALDIIDKMERRISLLGNHDIKMPEIAVPWNWMDKELQKAFLDIFEGDSRESIVPYLKKQLGIICKEENMKSDQQVSEDKNSEEEKIIRINSKFIAIRRGDADITNIENISSKYGYRYIPGKDCLTIYNVESGEKKEMKCPGIITPESKIFDINSKGFSILTNNILYDIRRG